MKFHKKDILLYCIFAIGIFLRFYRFWDWSYTNDELSALNRVNYDGFSDLIRLGINTDVHPALVQTFLYYWTSFLGKSEFWVRLPFVLASVISLFYFYGLSKRLFSKQASLISTAIFSISYPFIVYSQIARPYSFGVLFVIAFSYYWIKLLNEKPSKKIIAGYILFGLAGLLTHYFAALSIFLLMLIGLFTIKRKKRIHYLIYCISIALLFLPHLNITLTHLSAKGLGWAPKPEFGYILKYLNYVFTYSFLLQIVVLLLPIIAFLSKKFYWKPKKQLVLFLLFIIPYWIGFYYSILFAPVLQYSALIFSLPFLFLFSTSFITDHLSKRFTLSICLIILFLGSYSLFISQNFYANRPFANFKKVAENIIDWNEKYGQENIMVFTNGNSPNYLAHYLNQENNPPDREIAFFDTTSKIMNAIKLIESKDKDYILLAFANGPIPNIIHEHAKANFPEIIEHARYFNSDAILYKRSDIKRKVIFETNYESFKSNEAWQVKPEALVDSIYYDNSPSFQLNKEDEFGLTFKSKIEDISNDSNRFITVTAKFKSQMPNHAHLVSSISFEGKQLSWQSIELIDYWMPNQWVNLIDVLEIKKEFPKDAEITIYFWNREHEILSVDDFKIINFADSDYNYYDFVR